MNVVDTRLENLDYYLPILGESFSSTTDLFKFRIINCPILGSFEIKHTETLSFRDFLIDYIRQVISLIKVANKTEPPTLIKTHRISRCLLYL